MTLQRTQAYAYWCYVMNKNVPGISYAGLFISYVGLFTSYAQPNDTNAYNLKTNRLSTRPFRERAIEALVTTCRSRSRGRRWRHGDISTRDAVANRTLVPIIAECQPPLSCMRRNARAALRTRARINQHARRRWVNAVRRLNVCGPDRQRRTCVCRRSGAQARCVETVRILKDVVGWCVETVGTHQDACDRGGLWCVESDRIQQDVCACV